SSRSATRATGTRTPTSSSGAKRPRASSRRSPTGSPSGADAARTRGSGHEGEELAQRGRARVLGGALSDRPLHVADRLGQHLAAHPRLGLVGGEALLVHDEPDARKVDGARELGGALGAGAA